MNAGRDTFFNYFICCSPCNITNLACDCCCFLCVCVCSCVILLLLEKKTDRRHWLKVIMLCYALLNTRWLYINAAHYDWSLAAACLYWFNTYLECLLFLSPALWLCKRQREKRRRGRRTGRGAQGFNEKKRGTKHLELSLHSLDQCNQK